jgi:hypothetical protein
MAKLNIRSRHFLTFSLNGILIVGALLIIASTGCLPTLKTAQSIPFKNREIVYSNWDDLFEKHEILNFTFDEPKKEIFRIGGMIINNDGDYFIIDPQVTKVIQFDKERKFKRYIGKKGHGPGEYSTPALPFLDKENNLYIYDVETYRINKYRYPNYHFEKQIKLKTPVQSVFFDDEGFLILYSVSDPHVLHKVNLRGQYVKKVFQPFQMGFRLFSARFQAGRAVKVPGQGILLSYPAKYKVYLYDLHLNPRKILYSKTESTFFPGETRLPSNLNPYHFTPQHTKWWGKAMRLTRILYLKNGLFIQELAKFENMSAKFYANFHDLDGNTYAVGVSMPYDGFIQYVQGEYIFLEEDSKFDEDGNVIPLKLHRYKLKQQFLNQNKIL